MAYRMPKSDERVLDSHLQNTHTQDSRDNILLTPWHVKLHKKGHRQYRKYPVIKAGHSCLG